MRCYYGAPDADYQAHLSEQDRLRKLITNAGFTVTYFPNGEFYQAFRAYRSVTREHKSLFGVAFELNLTM